MSRFRMLGYFCAAAMFLAVGSAQPPRGPRQPPGPPPQGPPPPGPPGPPGPGPQGGGALPGITPAERARWDSGRREFDEIVDAADGLGPFFNRTSCRACHNQPFPGGGSQVTVLHAGNLDRATGVFTAPSLTTVVHANAVRGIPCRPRVPANTNVQARRISPPMLGDGLIEAIADDTLIALEDQGRRNADLTGGRVHRLIDAATSRLRIGRFGWKAQHATVLAFAADAFRTEMGITNDIFRQEVGAGFTLEQLAGCDTTVDPEDKPDPATGLRGIDRLADFVKFLAPPQRGPVNAEAAAGEAVFAQAGCAACHVPVLTTAGSPNPAFDRKPVRLYSDLLLHDVGTGDGIGDGDARPNEIRTPPLWGLRFRNRLLHDGRARGAQAAIEAHAREAARSVERYRALTPEDRQALTAFLGSL